MKQALKRLSVCCLLMYLILSCTEKKSSEIITVAVDHNQLSELSLSDISENVKPIRLELTDESMMASKKMFIRILYDEKYIIVVESKAVMLFDNNGKFICCIGSIGQGPGEFVTIMDVTADFEDKHIYIYTVPKIICYDFEGKLQKEIKAVDAFSLNGCITYANKELLLAYEYQTEVNGEKVNVTNLKFYDKDLLLRDSIKVKEVHCDRFCFYFKPDYIVNDNNNTYFYFADIVPNSPSKLDILYKIENNQLIPICHLKFKNDGISMGEKIITIFSMYRSSRFIFSYYWNESNRQFYNFCYDTKTNKSHNLKGGYLDDYYTHEKVDIRPFRNNSNMYYFLHTNMSDDDKDEPNPTLYIGTLKK